MWRSGKDWVYNEAYMLLPKPARQGAIISYVSIIVGVLIVGIAASVYVYVRFDESVKSRLIDRAATMALLIPAGEIEMLEGASTDEQSPTYQNLKMLLMDVRAANRDVRFVYLIGQLQDGNLFFYLDSEDAASPDVSPPGQIYDEAPLPMYDVLSDGRSRSDSYVDRWGSWVSGYAAVRADDGRIVALLGIDTPSRQYFIEALSYALLPLLLSLFLVLIGSVALYIHIRELRYTTERIEFLSIASHEIRTPLTGMRWALGTLLEHKTAFNQHDSEILTRIQTLCDKLISRINNLLNVSAIGSRRKIILNKKQVPFKALISVICDDLALSARARDVALVVDSTLHDDCIVACDPEYLQQVFLNLLSNSIKYTKEHTSVTISYRAGDRTHAFCVSDQGSGIKKEDVEKIFSGYHRTSSALDSGEYGTGIGLYLTLQIVRLHGGDIAIESPEGSGATFVVTLPR